MQQSFNLIYMWCMYVDTAVLAVVADTPKVYIPFLGILADPIGQYNLPPSECTCVYFISIYNYVGKWSIIYCVQYLIVVVIYVYNGTSLIRALLYLPLSIHIS